MNESLSPARAPGGGPEAGAADVADERDDGARPRGASRGRSRGKAHERDWPACAPKGSPCNTRSAPSRPRRERERASPPTPTRTAQPSFETKIARRRDAPKPGTSPSFASGVARTRRARARPCSARRSRPLQQGAHERAELDADLCLRPRARPLRPPRGLVERTKKPRDAGLQTAS